MNKSELVELISKDADISKAAAGRALQSVVDRTTAALRRGDTVAITSFGTFGVTKRAARTGKNPRTGESLTIAARKSPSFKPSSVLKDSLN